MTDITREEELTDESWCEIDDSVVLQKHDESQEYGINTMEVPVLSGSKFIEELGRMFNDNPKQSKVE